MKALIILTLTAYLLLPFLSIAQDVSPSTTNGWFKLQQKVEADISEHNRGMASISFMGYIFNFVNYNLKDNNYDAYNGNQSSVIVRKLNNKSSDPATPVWGDKKIDDIKAFQYLYWGCFQPAPVIFNDTLYLFVLNDEAKIAYSKYDPIADSWSKLTAVVTPDVISLPDHTSNYPYFPNYNFTGMSASVVDNKLCLVGSFNNTITIYWTDEQRAKWHTIKTDMKTYCNDYNGDYIKDSKKFKPSSYICFPYISSIGTTFMDSDVRRDKLMFGYINSDKHVVLPEYYFKNDTLTFIKSSSLDPTYIGDPNVYSSVALASGTVTGDPASEGKCIQAFVKCYNIQNLSSSCRIKRFELKNGVWSQAESNVVKQNYGWAWPQSNLTVANYSVPQKRLLADNSVVYDFLQYMCLVYQSKYGTDLPLNCALAETDRLVYISSQSDVIADSANTHYVGYIEGPPPFHLNDSINHLQYPYFFGPGSTPISNASFEVTEDAGESTDFNFKVGLTSKFKIGCLLEASVKTEFGGIFKTEKETEIIENDDLAAGESKEGVYIVWRPEISKQHYSVVDANGHEIDSIYYYYVVKPHKYKLYIPLKNHLDPSQPRTYLNRPELNNCDIINTGDVVWSRNSPGTYSVKNTKSNTDGWQETASFEVGFGERHSGGEEPDKFFRSGPSGEFEYSSVTTTSNSTEMKCIASLNEPKDSNPLDCNSLNYTVYWLNYTPGEKNWWVPKGAENQEIWCLTYHVYYYELENGVKYTPSEVRKPNTHDGMTPALIPAIDIAGSNVEKSISQQTFLAQNSPNPFHKTTKFKYQVGTENLQPNQTSCVTRLVIYNLSGQQVATLVNENKAPGSYEVEWDASQFTPGVYFYSLQSGSFKDIKKLILLK